jgi:tetratricopeptide (TPR) repeat protein
MPRRALRWAGAAALAVLLAGSAGCLRDRVAAAEAARRESFDLLTRGQELRARGDFLLARDTFLRAIALSPRPVLYFETGHCYFRLGELETAIDYYDLALATAPDFQRARAERDLARVELAARTGQPAAPAAHGDDGRGAPADAPREIADAARPNPATPTPTPAPTPSPTSVPPAVTPAPAGPSGALASAFAGMRDDDKEGQAALPDLPPEEVRRVIFPELDTQNPPPLAELRTVAAEAQRRGRFDEAIRGWMLVLAQDPGDVEARINLAWAYHKSGRGLRAAEEYETLGRLFPDNPRVAYEQGNYQVEVGDLESARGHFMRAIALDGNHDRARNNLAVIELRTGNPQRAVELLEEVVARMPDFEAAWLNLALARDDAGQPPAAVLEALERHSRLLAQPNPATDRWIRELRQRGAATP